MLVIGQYTFRLPIGNLHRLLVASKHSFNMISLAVLEYPHIPQWCCRSAIAWMKVFKKLLKALLIYSSFNVNVFAIDIYKSGTVKFILFFLRLVFSFVSVCVHIPVFFFSGNNWWNLLSLIHHLLASKIAWNCWIFNW